MEASARVKKMGGSPGPLRPVGRTPPPRRRVDKLRGPVVRHGPVDQSGRSPVLQTGGLGFKSRPVHVALARRRARFGRSLRVLPAPRTARDRARPSRRPVPRGPSAVPWEDSEESVARSRPSRIRRAPGRDRGALRPPVAARMARGGGARRGGAHHRRALEPPRDAGIARATAGRPVLSLSPSERPVEGTPTANDGAQRAAGPSRFTTPLPALWSRPRSELR
jgi:hypothetical protein